MINIFFLNLRGELTLQNAVLRIRVDHGGHTREQNDLV